MKKFKNLMIMILAIFGIIGTGSLNVNAAPSSITLKSKSSMYYYTENNGTDYISGYNFYRKELTNGTLVYCVSNIDTEAPGGKTISLVGEITDKGLSYILTHGYPNNSFTGNGLKDYYITQAAIWEYFDETRGSNNWGKTSFTSSDTGMKGYVYQLVTAAKKANTSEVSSESINFSVKNKNMGLSGKYYVSNPIKVTLEGTADEYTVSLTSAPKNTIIKSVSGEEKTTFKNGEEFKVYVPATVTKSGSVKLSVKTTVTHTKTYEYSANQGKLQNIGLIVTENDELENNLTLKYTVVQTKLSISKQDVTSQKELPGATLVLADKDGNTIETWVSTDEPHYIEGLNPGTYVLSETIAPKDYKLTTSTIEFTLERDGNVKTVVMYNEKLEPTKLKISKQDVTSKEELPGATLELKDSKGKLVETWVSGDKPHYIEGLEPGEYTLTETIAPKDYKLTSSTITFKLERNGKVKTVVMYNELLTKLKISKQDITSKEELPGATLVIKDSNGKIIDKWVSSDKPHYIEGLEPGEYTLTETIAPEGYVLSSSTIKFNLESNGKVKTVVMYNAKEEITRLSISKQDITSKEELPGATLELRDKDGVIVDSWVSETTPHFIEGLEPGEYTLTETIAPDGYKLSEETIKFTLERDGNVKTVVMYNEQYSVPITDLNIKTSIVIGAALLMILGSGMVFYAKRVY